MTRASDLAKLLGAGATILDGTTISTADNTDQLTLTSTDADANVAPNLRLYRNSGSPADSDQLGKIQSEGRNDNSQDVIYAEIGSQIKDASDGTEDGRIFINSMVAGTLKSRMNITEGETVFNDESVDLDFRVESNNYTHALFIQGGSDKVGIGDSSPNSYNNYASNLVINNGGDSNGHVGMTIACATDKIGSIYFADGTTGNQAYRGAIYYSHANDRMYFLAAGGAAMYINASGNVGIGTDQDAHGLTIYRHLQSYGGIMIQNGTNNTGQVFQAFHNYNGDRIGSISQNNSAVVYNTSSDYRLKENVSYTFDATSRLKQLKPARFNWISDDTNTTIDGFLAHEVSDIVPEAITGKKDGTQDLGTVKDADGNVIETNLSETFFTERKKETVDKDGNTEAAIYPSDYTWTKTATENVYQGIDQSKIVPLLTKTILELEARITALESA